MTLAFTREASRINLEWGLNSLQGVLKRYPKLGLRDREYLVTRTFLYLAAASGTVAPHPLLTPGGLTEMQHESADHSHMRREFAGF
jgi:hypothetical protein